MVGKDNGRNVGGRVALALIGVGLLFVLADVLDLDARVTSLFYTSVGEEPWPLGNHVFWKCVDRYGELPGLAMAAMAGFVLWRLRRRPESAAQRRDCWLLILLVVFGAGLMIHGLRLGWGRPRPRNVLHWQEPVPYREWWQPGGPGTGRSFPSGHVGLAVTLVAGASVATRRRRLAVRATALAAALSFAILVTLSRWLDGAHYATDALWSWVLILGFWWALEHWLPRPPPEPESPSPVAVADAC